MTDRFIDPVNGTDTGSGSQSAPWRTWGFAAINAASGDGVFQKRGTTANEAVDWNTKSGNTLGAYGDGSRPVITANGSVKDATFRLGTGGVTISGLDINSVFSAVNQVGVKLSGPSAGAVVTDLRITGSAWDNVSSYIGLLVETAGAFEVRGNRISGFRDNAQINFATGIKGSFERNYIFGSGLDGLRMLGGDFARSVLIYDNEITNFIGDGIDLFSASGALIEKNRVHDVNSAATQGHGIKCGGTSGNRNEVHGNTVWNCNLAALQTSGIITNGSYGNHISHNRVLNCYRGITCDGVGTSDDIVSHNIVTGATKGLDVVGALVQASFNFLDGSQYDIGVSSNGVATVYKNVLKNKPSTVLGIRVAE